MTRSPSQVARMLAIYLGDCIRGASLRGVRRTVDAAHRADLSGRARGAVERCIAVAEDHALSEPHRDAASHALADLGE